LVVVVQAVEAMAIQQGRSQPLSFLVTTDMPCPYLPDRMERKLVTRLAGPEAAKHFHLLSRAGFRRSHSIAYRPACPGCSACVGAFKPGRSLRRLEARNADLTASIQAARGTAEQYQLFQYYLDGRHGDGEMAGMSLSDYRSMVEDTPIDTRLVEFRDDIGRLVACVLTDWSEDGISAVYSFFDPEQPARSLGSYMIVWLLREAARSALPYVYLGYWVGGSRKMGYKTRFRPIEGFGPQGWQRIA
jgi:arginyl-tRNA--protein-N-Asp/Glu arginylyltransferase